MRHLALIGILLVGVTAAQARVDAWSAEWLDASPFDMDRTSFAWDAQDADFQIYETYDAEQVDSSVSRSVGQAGINVVQPTIDVTKTVVNNTTFDWTEYTIEITGTDGVSYVMGSGASDVYGAPTSEAGGVLFFDGATVPNDGSAVTFSFQIAVPEDAGFTFDISQTPVPEPASLMLLALGGFLLRRR